MYADLNELNQAVRNCRGCVLSDTRNQVVCGDGCIKPRVFLLGEAPGGDEDLSGKPFTGQAGKELDRFLSVLELSRQDIYIGNTVKCRPTRPSRRGRYGAFANRKPLAGEIKACAGWLDKEIRLVDPRVIVTLGGVPLSRVLGKQVPVGNYRGNAFFSEKYRCHVFPLYHPAAVIYDRSKKDVYLNDLSRLRDFLSELDVMS